MIELLVDKGDRVVAGQLIARIDRDLQEPQIRAAEAQLVQAQTAVNLEETEICAPFDGIITQKYVEEGQLISNAIPSFALQNPLDNWIDFKISETQLKNLSIGDKVTVIGRDQSLRLEGTIESIRRKADFATQKATSEREDVDVVAFNVKVRTDSEVVWSGMRFALDGVH